MRADHNWVGVVGWLDISYARTKMDQDGDHNRDRKETTETCRGWEGSIRGAITTMALTAGGVAVVRYLLTCVYE